MDKLSHHLNRKCIYLFISILLLLSIIGCIKNKDNNEIDIALKPNVSRWYVTNKKGAILWDNVPQKYAIELNPPAAQIIKTIPYGEIVTIKSYECLEVKVDNINDVFAHIEWNGYKGVVFNGYLGLNP